MCSTVKPLAPGATSAFCNISFLSCAGLPKLLEHLGLWISAPVRIEPWAFPSSSMGPFIGFCQP
jgi:hypothetical protein